VIKTFAAGATQRLFDDAAVPRFRSIERAVRRKLLYLHCARNLQNLMVPPGNRLEMLKNNRRGHHSIRVNDQWCICFRWQSGDDYEVEIVDCH